MPTGKTFLLLLIGGGEGLEQARIEVGVDWLLEVWIVG